MIKSTYSFANLNFILRKKRQQFHRLWFCRIFLNDCQGTIVVQDLFQLNFCVTRAYNTQAWRKHCKYVVRRITSKWFDQNWWRSIKENLVDIFEYSFEATKNTKKSPYKESKSKLEISWSWTYSMRNKRMKSNLLKLKRFHQIP